MTSITIEEKIRRLAAEYAERLKERIDQRVEEMEGDDKSHFLVYRVLGITDEEGHLIDVYQNKGRFLYRYAASATPWTLFGGRLQRRRGGGLGK